MLDGERPRALNAVPLVLVPSGNPAGRLGGELLGEQLAVGTLGNVVLLDHEGIEKAAVARLGVVLAGLVDGVLRKSVLGTEGSIEGTGEEVLADALRGVVVHGRALLGLLATLRSLRLGLIGLGVSVGTDDGNLELATVLAKVVGSLRLDAGSPERALEVGNGIGLVAGALLGVPLGVTLNVDVEGGAQVLVVTPVGAGLNIVRLEGAVAKVRVGVDSGGQVLEGVGVALGVISGLGHLVKNLVVAESLNGIGVGDRTETIGLNSTRVLRVDEAAVSANLVRGRAGRVGSEGKGVGPGDRSAGRRNLMGG